MQMNKHYPKDVNQYTKAQIHKLLQFFLIENLNSKQHNVNPTCMKYLILIGTSCKVFILFWQRFNFDFDAN